MYSSWKGLARRRWASPYAPGSASGRGRLELVGRLASRKPTVAGGFLLRVATVFGHRVKGGERGAIYH